MNYGFLPFPGRKQQSAYRYLDTSRLSSMSGDVPEFRAAMIRPDAGDPIRGLWRPFDGTYTPTLSIEDGALVVAVAAVAASDHNAAAQTLLVGDFDVVLELVFQVPDGFPSSTGENFQAGVFVEIDGDATGGGICCGDSEVAFGITNYANEFACQVVPDITVATLPMSAQTAVGNIPATRLQPLLVRAKRQDTSLRCYLSQNRGTTWNSLRPNIGTVVDADAPARLAIFGGIGMTTPGDNALRVLCTGLKHYDPRCAFP